MQHTWMRCARIFRNRCHSNHTVDVRSAQCAYKYTLSPGLFAPLSLSLARAHITHGNDSPKSNKKISTKTKTRNKGAERCMATTMMKPIALIVYVLNAHFFPSIGRLLSPFMVYFDTFISNTYGPTMIFEIVVRMQIKVMFCLHQLQLTIASFAHVATAERTDTTELAHNEFHYEFPQCYSLEGD